MEDDRAISNLLRLYLEKEGIEITVTYTAETALLTIKAADFDLMLLNVNLPGRDGFELLADLRRRHDLSVLVLTARDSEENIVFAFGVGADDYMTKPFPPKVLTFPRARPPTSPPRVRRACRGRTLRFGSLSIDLDACPATLDGQRLNLARREFELLAVIAVAVEWIIASKINRSVPRLQRATRKIADGDLDFELNATRQLGAGVAGTIVRPMRGALKEETEHRSRLLAADVKTPLTAIKGYLEAIADVLAEDRDCYLGIITDKSD